MNGEVAREGTSSYNDGGKHSIGKLNVGDSEIAVHIAKKGGSNGRIGGGTYLVYLCLRIFYRTQVIGVNVHAGAFTDAQGFGDVSVSSVEILVD